MRDFVALTAEELDLAAPIYEFGSYQVEGQERLSDLRELFPGKSYTGCDMRPGKGVDRIENIESPALPDGCAGTVLCVDTLEHVKRPHVAVSQMRRLLAPDGILVLSSVMDFPVHEHPHDYWRFTPDGLKCLFSEFGAALIGTQGPQDHPHTVFAVGFRGELGKRCQAVKRFCSRAPDAIRADLEVRPYKMKILRTLAALPGLRGGNFVRQVLGRYLYAGFTRFELFLPDESRANRG